MARARYGLVTRSIKPSLRSVCKIGTLAHNTDFSPRDFAEYSGSVPGALAALVKRGIVKRVRAGRYYPTNRGWDVMETLMARRRLKSIRVGKCSVTIHRDSEWDEYVVTTRAPAKRLSGTYHTTDKRDARGTAAFQIRALRKSGEC